MSDPIVHFEGSLSKLNETINKHNGLVVVDFFATWCGPCQRLGQILPGIANENKDVLFIKADVDKNGESASHFGVSSIPHIFFLKVSGGKYDIVDQVIGADVSRIKANIAKFK